MTSFVPTSNLAICLEPMFEGPIPQNKGPHLGSRCGVKWGESRCFANLVGAMMKTEFLQYGFFFETIQQYVRHHNWVVVSNIFYFHPYLGKIPILTNIFQMGWNHQLDKSEKKSTWIQINCAHVLFSHPWSVGFSGSPKNGTPWAPYYSHTTPIRIPKNMGIVLEACHKGVPLLGVPGKSPLTWQTRNFASYFLVNRSGVVQHLPGGRNSPSTMKATVEAA